MTVLIAIGIFCLGMLFGITLLFKYTIGILKRNCEELEKLAELMKENGNLKEEER